MTYGLDEKGLRRFVMQSFDWLEHRYPDLAGWLSYTCTYLSAHSLCEIKDYGDGVLVNLFSDQRIYHINARSGPKGYLGLTFSCRSTGAGNDLPDGPYSKDTWHRIVCAMLSCELISLKRRDDPNHED